MMPPLRVFLSPPDMTSVEKAALDVAFASNFVAPVGPALDAFERGLEAYLAGRQGGAGGAGVLHATRSEVRVVALSSGTAGLHLACHLAGIGPGDAVVLPTMTFAATAFAVGYTGAQVIFADVTPETWTLCPAAAREAVRVARALGLRVRALMPVDLYGQCADYVALRALCQEEGLLMIQDAAEAVGSRFGAEPAGLQGDFGVFSFNGNKLMTTGGGGALLLRDAALAERARKVAQQAREPGVAYLHQEVGFNYRLSNLSAAVGCGQLQRLPELLAKRAAVRARYEAALGGLPGVSFNPIGATGASNYWLTCLVLEPGVAPAPEVLMGALRAAGIESRPLWKPMHQQPVFAGAPMVGGAVADRLFATGLCLPSGSSMTPEIQAEVCETLAAQW